MYPDYLYCLWHYTNGIFYTTGDECCYNSSYYSSSYN